MPGAGRHAELHFRTPTVEKGASSGRADSGGDGNLSFVYSSQGWVLDNGQLMPINQDQALFSLLGKTFGGDGRTTFALPNLQGSTVIQPGQGSGLSERFRGVQGRDGHAAPIRDAVALTLADGLAGPGDNTVPGPNVSLAGSVGGNIYANSANQTLAPQALLAAKTHEQAGKVADSPRCPLETLKIVFPFFISEIRLRG
jgi:microcystin-dependent protein